jgi:hypothetical protein
MKTCQNEDNHKNVVVVYDEYLLGRGEALCPLCECIDARIELAKEVDDLRERVEDLLCRLPD